MQSNFFIKLDHNKQPESPIGSRSGRKRRRRKRLTSDFETSSTQWVGETEEDKEEDVDQGDTDIEMVDDANDVEYGNFKLSCRRRLVYCFNMNFHCLQFLLLVTSITIQRVRELEIVDRKRLCITRRIGDSIPWKKPNNLYALRKNGV